MNTSLMQIKISFMNKYSGMRREVPVPEGKRPKSCGFFLVCCLSDFLKSFSPASRNQRIELNAILLPKELTVQITKPSLVFPHICVVLLTKPRGET